MLRLNGINWFHERSYSSLGSWTPNWQGENWWSNEMINLTVSGAEGASDVSVQFDPNYTFNFTYAASAWTCDDNYELELTFDSGNDEYKVTRVDGWEWVFHDDNATNAGKLKRIEDPYDNDWQFNYSSGQLTDIVVDVVGGTDHKITYSYFTSGDSNGRLQYIKAYKSTTTTSANLIGQIEYIYHENSTDGYGTLNDLMKAIVTRKATNDGDGTLSIEETYRYRYYDTNHRLRYVLLPENAQRLNEDVGTPENQTNTNWASYANIAYQYDVNDRVSQVDERLPSGSGCGCGGGSDTGTTTFNWTTNSGSPDLDTWSIHMVADREDDSRIIADFNRVYQPLTWVVQDDKTSPAMELVWHWDYGTSGDTESRMTAAYLPSAVSAYDETTAPYAVTLNSSDGVVYVIEYDTGNYAGYPKKIRIQEGDSGSPDTLVSYTRITTARPDLPLWVKTYESAGEVDARTTTYTYAFYDADKYQFKQSNVTFPSVSTSKNGPGTTSVTKFYHDLRTGAIRWKIDPEGYVSFYAYDDATGVRDLTVRDVNTTSLMSVITSNWHGTNHGGLTGATDIPSGFTRTGVGDALDIDSSAEIDWLGRNRKTTDAGGMVTYFVYKDDEARVFPAWYQDGSDYKTLSPGRITKTDKDGRPEEQIMLDTTFVFNNSSGTPIGTTSYTNADFATWTVMAYNKAGQLTDTDRYHAIPASGSGTRYTNFYRTTNEYDNMGRLEYVISDVADDSPQDVEQVTETDYDFLGRAIARYEGVSGNSHAVSPSNKPTMVKTIEMFYDDPDSDSTPEQGEGDGNLRWVRKWHGIGGGDYNDTEYRYDWRNRRQLIVPSAAPYTLIKHDNLDRVLTTGEYSATTNLDPGDDPATTENGNRIGLSKTYYDEQGRVYLREVYQDPGDATPEDDLATNTYYDRRGLDWATDAPNSGISFTQYDGLGRRTQTMSGTQFDTAKYASNAPDYPDDDEGLVEATEFTLDEVGNVQKTIRKELNHDDTDGMDLTNNDDYVRTYVYRWYDDAHRLSDTVNYGTNNADGWKDTSTAPTYGASAPARSDTVLVTTYAYHDLGWRDKVTDPKSVATFSEFDALGRVTRKDEADGTGGDRITKYAYNGLGSLTSITADLTTTDQTTEYVYGDTQSARWVTTIKYPATDTENGKTLGEASSETYDQIVMTYNIDGTLATRTDQNGNMLTWSYDSLRRKTEVEVTTVGSGVDSTVRAFTWTYNDDGLVERATSHSDTTPDTSTWTDALNQIKYTYDDGNNLTTMEMDHDSEVGDNTGVDTRSISLTYGTDFTTSGNYKRVNYVTYPSGRKVWYGYTHHDTANTFQDTINDKFSRIGQIAKDNSGAIGDIMAHYDFNGLRRMVRRNHEGDDTAGFDGNDTRIDLWHGTSGDYDGFDRFGRIVDMKHTEFSGTAVDFDRFKYSYDRAGNRTKRENDLYAARSQAFDYNDLYQLTVADEGLLDSSGDVELSDIQRGYNMDVLGNFNGTNGIKINGVNDTIKHTTNATNEITTLAKSSPGGIADVINDGFGSTLSSLYTAHKGTWSTASGEVNVDSLTSGAAVLTVPTPLDDGTIEAKVTFPSGSTIDSAGVVFGHDGDNSYHVAVLNKKVGVFAVYPVNNGTFGSALASTAATIGVSPTQYYIKVKRRQSQVEAEYGQGATATATISYTTRNTFEQGETGLYADATNIKFDDLSFARTDAFVSKLPGWKGTAEITVTTGSPGNVQVNGATRGGELVFENFQDDDYMVEFDASNSAKGALAYVRYQDPNNYYSIGVFESTDVQLKVVENGYPTTITTPSITDSGWIPVKIKLSGTSIKVWVNGTLKINETDSTHAYGGVALTGSAPKFRNIKIGYDNSAPADVIDDLILDEDFGSTSVTMDANHANAPADSWDKNGSLLNDGLLKYEYDAWNRLVKVKSAEEGLTIGTHTYDAAGRRIKKAVQNSGDLDGTHYYYYNASWRLLETRDGSENLDMQVIPGTQYVDEIVRFEKQDHGTMYVTQDANWNVSSTTNQAGDVLERISTTPYGEPTFDTYTINGDYDGDSDLDSTDDSNLTTCKSGTQPVTGACRVFDFDNDGDVDTIDEARFDDLYTGSGIDVQRSSGRRMSRSGLAFTHHGLLSDAESNSFSNRNRFRSIVTDRFISRDPNGQNSPMSYDLQYSDGMNLYVTARNNPIRIVDPLGLEGTEPWEKHIPLVCAGHGIDQDGVCTYACEIADFYDLEVVGGEENAGGVICCCGQQFACAWHLDDHPPAATECTIVHEQAHFDSTACEDCSSLHRPSYQGPDFEAEECDAAKREIACLIAANGYQIPHPGSSMGPNFQSVCDWLQTNCGEASQFCVWYPPSEDD